MTSTSDPMITLYIYRRNQRIVAVAIGQYPPDIASKYDSLTRVPIVKNGKRPPWRTFTHHIGQGESIGQALARREWPNVEAATPPATPPPNRGKRPRPARKRQPQVGDTITWNGDKYRILAINANNQVFARHTQTKEPINIDLTEVAK